MQCTPEQTVYQRSGKSERCHDCTDSGYSGTFQSPWRATDLCRTLSPVTFVETPKENLRLTATRERSREPVRLSAKDSRGSVGPSAVSWCETPKLCKRDASLRQRLLMCKLNADVNNESGSSQCSRGNESSVSVKSESWLRASFESLDIGMDTLASSAFQEDQDQALSGRKRRLLFSQMRTSTLNDDKLNSGHFTSFERGVLLTDADFGDVILTPDQPSIGTPGLSRNLPVLSKENSQLSDNDETNNLYDRSSVLSTPSSLHTPKYIRSMREDSGFSSLDKSQDSSGGHDGSFQELLRSVSKGNSETPNQGEAKRRPRLLRQHRLSTLKEGGSQSEEDPVDKKQLHSQYPSCSQANDVFTEDVTPGRNFSAKHDGSLTSAKQVYTTPLRTTKFENMTPRSTESSIPDVTPHRSTPVSLSLTPALELVHAMCQHNAQMFAGQSPSLKEQLKSTAGLVETPVRFRTVMPLAGLIGRKMGLGKVDILTELKKRNLRHILAAMLTMLDPESISSFSQVCKSWDEIIQQDKWASLRRRNHLNEVGAALEQSSGVHIFDTDTRATLVKRSALKMVQPQSRTSTNCTPQSRHSTLTSLQHATLHSGSSSKRNKFLEVAKTLFSDECLRPCPRCEHPARCQSVKREGVCSRVDCGFQFCTSCLCSFHGSRECGSQSGGRRKNDVLIPGSADSKRNVRRL